jgi:hypothetical protein
MSDTPFDATNQSRCSHCKFGLIVTGAGEREFVPQLFRSLTERAGCSFKVLRKIGQRSAMGKARRLKMVGQNKIIPDRDCDEIGLPARRFLQNQPCHFVIVLDDVEHDRRHQIADVFGRYRAALETMLRPEDYSRAAVHFFSNMIEAYYLAHSDAVNSAVGKNVLDADHEGDVEAIRHPKDALKRLAKRCDIAFDEKAHGAAIVSRIDVDHVLSRPNSCAFLRALFAWCVRQLLASCPIWDASLANRYEIPQGDQADLTARQ